MAKLTLALEPTFEALVPIPVPGKEPVPVKFTFKHRDTDQLNALIKAMRDKPEDFDDVTVAMSVAEGWDLDDVFNRDNVERLLKKFHAAADAISKTYITELTQARIKN
jgi:hypothetical protein